MELGRWGADRKRDGEQEEGGRQEDWEIGGRMGDGDGVWDRRRTGRHKEQGGREGEWKTGRRWEGDRQEKGCT